MMSIRQKISAQNTNIKLLIEDRNSRMIIIVLIFNILVNIANIIRIYLHRGLEFGDYLWVWKENVCTVQGKDIMDAIRNQSVINGVEMPSTSATMPYARVLSNLIHPGFMNREAAIGYGVILYIAVTVVAIIVLYKAANKVSALPANPLRLLVVILMFSSWYWTDGIFTWNNGVVFSMFLIIAVCIIDEHEMVGGVILALAMIKPQIAGIFYISFLMKKKYKAMLTSGFILIVSWGIYLVAVGGNPITQMLEIMGQAKMKEAYYIWFGLFDFLVKFGIQGTAAIISSMTVGMAATAVLSWWVIKNKNLDNTIIYYSIPALFSTVWCYKSTSDLVILILPTLLCLFIMEQKNTAMAMSLFTILYIITLNVKVFFSIFRRILGYELITGTSLDAYARVVMFLLMLFFLDRIDRKRGLECQKCKGSCSAND